VAHSLSAEKRIRQNLKRRARNRARKTALKTKLRKLRDALTKGDASAAETPFRVAVQALDRAAAKRTIHPNAAARRKSRLAKRLNALKAKTTG